MALLLILYNITGTVVKLKKGKFLADLARPGDEILVARGGQGGRTRHSHTGCYYHSCFYCNQPPKSISDSPLDPSRIMPPLLIVEHIMVVETQLAVGWVGELYGSDLIITYIIKSNNDSLKGKENIP
ncbi:hypothetical protein KSP40_PGU003931 [Platanthera guangdongensis]|uniref:Uncharacterized protein n=1 Tax=Platanthera guangdongensis TaxID=2320717 RepID=A0ABR2LX87_9ASPA